MNYNVTDIVFDFDDDEANTVCNSDLETFFIASNSVRREVVEENLGVWEADSEEDLIEEITAAAGWCIKSIDYDIQLKQEYDRSISVTFAGCFIAPSDYNSSITNEFHYDF